MRAVTVHPGQAKSLHVREDVPDPRPADGEALVRVLEAGVCGTDAEIDMGLYGEAPAGAPYLILGHENLGVVERIPEGSGLAPGDLVVSTVRRPCPERCRACADEQQDLCLSGHYTERGIKGRHGFMSDRYTESPHYLVHVPAELRGVAVLVEPLSFIEKGIEQALRFQQRLAWDVRRALVLGAGPVGLLASLVLRLRGLDVTVASREGADAVEARLVEDAGMRYAALSAIPVDRLAAAFGPFEIVFEATGAAAVVVPAMATLGLDGVCILSGVTGGTDEVAVDVASWNREMVLGNRAVFGTVNAMRRHFEAGVRDLSAAQARFSGWMDRIITRRLPVAEAPRALQRDKSQIKSVLQFD